MPAYLAYLPPSLREAPSALLLAHSVPLHLRLRRAPPPCCRDTPASPPPREPPTTAASTPTSPLWSPRPKGRRQGVPRAGSRARHVPFPFPFPVPVSATSPRPAYDRPWEEVSGAPAPGPGPGGPGGPGAAAVETALAADAAALAELAAEEASAVAEVGAPRERNAFACIKRHQAFALAPVNAFRLCFQFQLAAVRRGRRADAADAGGAERRHPPGPAGGARHGRLQHHPGAGCGGQLRGGDAAHAAAAGRLLAHVG